MAWTPTLDCDGSASGNLQHAKVIRPLADLEREAILEAVECCGAEHAAKLLGIGKTTLYRKLLLYGAAALSPQSHDSKTVIVISIECMRVLLHEADRVAKVLLLCKEETAPPLAQSLSKQIESFCQQFPQLKTWEK
jgi:hypothetical protein